MTSPIPGLDAASSNPRDDIDAASYYVLEPLRVGPEGMDVLSLDAVGDDDPDEQEPSFFGVALGYPDRPALRHAFMLDDIFEAILVLDELRAERPNARFWVADCHDEQGLEILGSDMLLGLIVAKAERGQKIDAREWLWLAEDAAGNRPPESRNYSPFFATLSQALKDRQAYLAARV